MEPIRISPYTLIWAGAGIGFLLGLIPLILGIRKGKTRFGVLAAISSAIGGAIAGIFLIIPIIAVFLWLILKKPVANTVSTPIENSDSEQFDSENLSSELSDTDISNSSNSDNS